MTLLSRLGFALLWGSLVTGAALAFSGAVLGFVIGINAATGMGIDMSAITTVLLALFVGGGIAGWLETRR